MSFVLRSLDRLKECQSLNPSSIYYSSFLLITHPKRKQMGLVIGSLPPTWENSQLLGLVRVDLGCYNLGE